jgi:hypothetical protein
MRYQFTKLPCNFSRKLDYGLVFYGNYKNVAIGVIFTCLFINSNEQMVY